MVDLRSILYLFLTTIRRVEFKVLSQISSLHRRIGKVKKGVEYKSTRNNDDFFLDVPRYTEDEDWSRTEGVVSLKDRTQEQLELKEKLLELC